mmetsp:Transcript_1183/g.2849  ORF Transcript_1183/g.2849 Transcript_1183/m.2849 type:complete len:108 (-) Transcript_1183:249-572(-)
MLHLLLLVDCLPPTGGDVSVNDAIAVAAFAAGVFIAIIASSVYLERINKALARLVSIFHLDLERRAAADDLAINLTIIIIRSNDFAASSPARSLHQAWPRQFTGLNN